MSAPTSKLALLRCLNVTNSQNIAVDNLDFGIPQATTENNKNTTIILSARPGTDLFGRRQFWYDRLALSLLALIDQNNEPIVVMAEDGQTYTDVLLAVNAHHRTGLTAEDLSNGATVLPTLATTPQSITLVASATSLVWLGELTVQVASAKTPIDSLLPESDLPGFYYSLPIDQALPVSDLPGFVYASEGGGEPPAEA